MSTPSTASLVRLGMALREAGYRFVTVTPETHARVVARGARGGETLTDAFGWNVPFRVDRIPAAIAEALQAGDLADARGESYVSRVRFSTLGGGLYAHSAFPTDAVDAVFFGPDTYRFCREIRRAALHPRVVVDIGCGSGAGGIVAGRRAAKTILADINEQALLFARANAELNGLPDVCCVQSDVLTGVTEVPDLVVANPPYLRDARGRTYRDGGGRLGEALAVRIAEESLARLAPGGTLLLYTGSAIVNGVDTFFEAVTPLLGRADLEVRYEEIDGDVFGEELSLAPYAAVDRIAAVVLEVTLPGSA